MYSVEELRGLHEERRALQPEDNPPSPPGEITEFDDSKMEIDQEEEVVDEDVNMDLSLIHI